MASPTTKCLAMASLLVLLSLAHGAIYRTVVTTTETITDEELGVPEKVCRKELEKHSFDSCRRYLQQQPQMIMSLVDQQQRSVPHQCCEQMRKVRDDCSCYVLRHVVDEEKKKEGKGKQGTHRQEMLERARQIPSQCDLKTGSCRINAEI